MKERTITKQKVINLCILALFSALAYICVLISPIKVNFLTFDTKDAVICIGGILLGPIHGVIISFVTALVEMVSISTTGPLGALMNFIQSTVFALTASLIYKYKRSMSGAVIGLASSVVATCTVMMGANLIITPFYMGVSTEEVAALIPSLLLPFNATKSLLNASLVLLLYKPVTTALRAAKLMPKNENTNKTFKYTGLVVTLCSLALIAACLVIFFVVLGGRLNFGK